MASAIGKERRYKKPRIMCPNGCGQMVSVNLDGTLHRHTTLHGEIKACKKVDIPDSAAEDVKDKTQSEEEKEDSFSSIPVNIIPSSPVSKVSSVIDATTSHPKLRLKSERYCHGEW